MRFYPGSYEQCPEITGDMTAFALRPECPAMNVIIVMATDARTWNDHMVTHRFLMARVAIQFPMSAIKLEFCARVVIKVPHFP